MTGQILSGGCLCGAVRYSVSGAPIDCGYCHCRICQRASGAPMVAWATFPVGCLSVTAGDPQPYVSSAHALRHFCRHCGTPISFRSRHTPAHVDITIASLDDPAALPPQYHIWTMSQIPWLQIDDHLPRHADGGPDRLV
jgi:hypothetical protein